MILENWHFIDLLKLIIPLLITPETDGRREFVKL